MRSWSVQRSLILCANMLCLTLGPALAEADMPAPELVAVDAAIDSVRNSPNQFNLTVNIVGTQATAIDGGTGLHVEAHGGESGSKTVGFSSRVEDSSVEVAQQQLDSHMRERADEAIGVLKEIRNELSRPQPQEESLTSLLGKLGETYLAPAVIEIIKALVLRRIG